MPQGPHRGVARRVYSMEADLTLQTQDEAGVSLVFLQSLALDRYNPRECRPRLCLSNIDP